MHLSFGAGVSAAFLWTQWTRWTWWTWWTVPRDVAVVNAADVSRCRRHRPHFLTGTEGVKCECPGFPPGDLPYTPMESRKDERQ